MGTKVKGFFKGLSKNISNIFDDEDEKDEEIQIGMPTDVKHVAHIGADGPAMESPSWMKDFDGKSQSGPLQESPYIQKGTNNHRISRSEELTRLDLSEKPKAHRHRHHHSIDSDSDHDSQSSTRRHTRRHRIRRSKDKGDESSRLPDIPKRSRRRKPKDDDGSVKSTQSQDTLSQCSEAPSDL